jgi:hypothetical protein
MEIILYREKKVAENFEKTLRASFPQIMVYTSMTALCTRLRHTPTQGVIIVLAAANEKELLTLMSIRHLLEDAPTIVLLPVKDSALLAKAHRLHPRFIGDLESGADEVIAVIYKMLTRTEPAFETNSTVRFH